MAQVRMRSAPVAEEPTRLLRPNKSTFKQSLRKLFWDADNQTCCTRSPINWLSITIYYIIFCLVVTGMMIFTLVLVKLAADKHPNRPKYVLSESPIGNTPTLNFFPMPYEQAPLIWLEAERPLKVHLDVINEQLKYYNEHGDEKCRSLLNSLGECKGDFSNFGYDEYRPCIFFKLNRILQWKPQPYKVNDSLPKEMPQRIRDLIAGGNEKIWIDCEGTTAKDRDRFSDNLQYWPDGFETSFFPYEKQGNFCDPLVSLRFKQKIDELDQIVSSVTCSAWGKGMDLHLTQIDIIFYFKY